MKFGKANAIRFWQNGTKLPEYMKQESYVQSWSVDDHCSIQLTDTSLKGYKAEILKNDVIVASLIMNNYYVAGRYVYQVTFRIGDYVTEGKFIVRVVTEEYMINGSATDGDELNGTATVGVPIAYITGTVTDGEDTTGTIQVKTVNSGLFGLSPIPCIYSETLYWGDVPWGTGVTMYTDIGLTNIVSSSYTYITKSDVGEIYELTNGVVGTATGIFC